MKWPNAALWLAGLALLLLLEVGWSAYQRDPALQLWLLGTAWCG
ncbi:hypothetical protein RQP53_14150 [Paucibacter sp. APW11]|uniref:Uncharacterized protein n=1 Tax=Roseateles aquae TaxID=3077235 RepID=A0ABU3PCW5_9BURK|nr:hypothetical protein [Paucibacter sp. APW11]MDT9000413.1 hypothetical protein [Paucibacter sp. APW11]